MKSRFYKGNAEHTKCVLGYLLHRYKVGNSISWLRERIEIIPPKAVWK